MIHARVYGGFGNRLPAMASIMVLSKLYNVDYKIYWSDDGAGSYKHIFDDRLDVIDFPNKDWNKFYEKLEGKFNACELKRDQYLSICNPIKCDINQLKQSITSLKFKSDIIVNNGFTNYIGIHLRCFHPLININNFLNSLHKLLNESDSSEKYFLCGDDEWIKNQVIVNSNLTIESYNAYCKRDYSKLSDQHAIRDLLTLSNCKSVIGSIGSTFTHFASYFNKKLIHLK